MFLAEHWIHHALNKVQSYVQLLHFIEKMNAARMWWALNRVLISCFPCSSELASDGLKGRVFEVSLADLQNDEVAFRKFRLISEAIQGKNVLTNFHGMTMTTDKLRSLVKKWQVSSVPRCD